MKLELVNEPLKVTTRTIIADLEDTMITVGKRSIIFPVVETQNFQTIGYYITGNVYLGADTIVNTKKGAVGDPIEKLSQAAFISYEDIDLSNTKSGNMSEKEFRNVEIKAYRYFQKMEESNIGKTNKYITKKGKHTNWPNKLEDLDFYAYLFEPEEFVFIKHEDSLIALSKDEKEVIVCDKSKNSYVEVSKDEGVMIQNDSGQVIKTDTVNGLMINGKNLNDIISNALSPVKEMFRRRF